jgi:hypothetical protein
LNGENAKPVDMSAQEWDGIQKLPRAIRESYLSFRTGLKSDSSNEGPGADPAQPERPTKKAPVVQPGQPQGAVQLPLWPEPQRASPNAFLRSAIFPAIQGKNRRYMKNELVAAQHGYELRFTGQMLDQSDFDIWLQAAHMARCSPVGTECRFTARGFLRSIGRAGGGKNLEWLKMSIRRLQSSVVEIKDGSKWMALNLLVRAAGDDESTAIYLKFDPILIQLFAADDWTALQWEERRRLKGKPLALWLHGYYSSHASPYPVKVETLKTMCGSETKEPRFFKKALQRAFAELEKVAGIKGSVCGDLVTIQRTPSPTQCRFLLNKSLHK